MDGVAPGVAPGALVIACGAIARELVQVLRAGGFEGVKVQCLPPELHNRPERIAGAVREAIAQAGAGRRVFVAYADCGTGGALDRVLEGTGIERLPGAHCYEFFAGAAAFEAIAEQEPGTFYLTDFLVRHFDRLIIEGLGLDRHPELHQAYFGNYRRLVYLSQCADDALVARARDAAERLGLEFEQVHTGLDGLRAGLAPLEPVAGTAEVD